MHELFDLEGDVWLSYSEGDGVARVMRYGGARSFSLGDVWVGTMADVAGSVWIATSGGAFEVSDEEIARVPDYPLYVSRIVEREGDVWILSSNEAHRAVDGRTVRYSTGEDALADVVVVNGVTWLLTKNIVEAGPAFRVCGDSLAPYDPAARVDAVEPAGADTAVRIQRPDFTLETKVVSAADLTCE